MIINTKIHNAIKTLYKTDRKRIKLKSSTLHHCIHKTPPYTVSDINGSIIMKAVKGIVPEGYRPDSDIEKFTMANDSIRKLVSKALTKSNEFLSAFFHAVSPRSGDGIQISMNDLNVLQHIIREWMAILIQCSGKLDDYRTGLLWK